MKPTVIKAERRINIKDYDAFAGSSPEVLDALMKQRLVSDLAQELIKHLTLQKIKTDFDELEIGVAFSYKEVDLNPIKDSSGIVAPFDSSEPK